MISPVPLWLLLHRVKEADGIDASLLELLGVAPACNAPMAVSLSPVLLVAALFAGPLSAYFFSLRLGDVASIGVPSLVTLRALVIAPISEEVVFRAAMVPLLVGAGASHAGVVLACAALFSLSHAHHYNEYVKRGWAPSAAARAIGFQLVFTGAFAALAAHAFLASGALWGVVASHALANALGPPDARFWRDKGHGAHWARGAVAAAYAGGIGGFLWLLATGAWLVRGGRCAIF
jgi:membrane protease YdiL (CAAX protease family)